MDNYHTKVLNVSWEEAKVREYLDWKLSPIPGDFSLSNSWLADICKWLKIQPEQLHDFIKSYCKDHGIILKIGGEICH